MSYTSTYPTNLIKIASLVSVISTEVSDSFSPSDSIETTIVSSILPIFPETLQSTFLNTFPTNLIKIATLISIVSTEVSDSFSPSDSVETTVIAPVFSVFPETLQSTFLNTYPTNLIKIATSLLKLPIIRVTAPIPKGIKYRDYRELVVGVDFALATFPEQYRKITLVATKEMLVYLYADEYDTINPPHVIKPDTPISFTTPIKIVKAKLTKPEFEGKLYIYVER
jgi:hypothetical protein